MGLKLAKVLGAVMMLGAVTGSAAAQEQDRDFCADRPGLGTPPCTLSPGAVQAEIGLGDWTWDKQGGDRTDMVLAGDALLRAGLAEHLEAQIGWTAYGHVRERAGGSVTTEDGVGDVTLALRRNLRNPDGSGASIAVMPYVTLPVGGQAIGAGDWGAGVLLPSSFDLNDGVSLEATGELDAAVDEDRNGRHLAWGGIVGVQFDVGDAVTASVEASAIRDDDPSGHETELLAGLSLGWQPSKRSQFDVGLNLGLNHDSPDGQVYVGFSRRL